MKLILRNTSMVFETTHVHFINLAKPLSSVTASKFDVTDVTGGGWKFTSQAVATDAWAYPTFGIFPAAAFEKTYYVCFDLEMIKNQSPAYAVSGLIKFNYPGTGGGYITYPAIGERSVVGAEITTPAQSGSALLSQLILQHTVKIPTTANVGDLEYIIRDVALIDTTDCSFSDLNSCISYLKAHGFNSVV